MKKNIVFVGLSAILLLFLYLLVSNQSFWFDEISTYNLISAPTFQKLLNALLSNRNSESEMPLFIIFSWCWKNIFGISEMALRSINIIWSFIVVACMFRLRNSKGSFILVVLILIHPFFLYYLSEFRPYMMLMAGGSLLLVSAVLLQRHDKNWSIWFTFSAIILIGANLLGLIPIICFSVFVLNDLDFLKKNSDRFLIFINLFVIVIFGFYYAQKLSQGAGGARHWKIGLSNLLFSLYEFLGFSGLGPGRSELRQSALMGIRHVLSQYGAFLPFILILIICYFAMAIIVVRKFELWKNQTFRMNLLFVVCCFLCLSAASEAFDWPFWGRHLSYLLPFILFNISMVFQKIGSKSKKNMLMMPYVFLLLVSSANIEFNSKYGRDDYRGAINQVQKEYQTDGFVWWVAPSPFSYYKLFDKNGFPIDFHSPESHQGIALIDGSSFFDSYQLPKPSLIVISKPEITDPDGKVKKFIEANSYQLAGELLSFTFWKPAGS